MCQVTILPARHEVIWRDGSAIGEQLGDVQARQALQAVA